MRDTAINDAIEHLVRVDVNDRDALAEATRALADTLGYELTPKPLPTLSVGDRIRLLRDLPGLKAGTEGEVIDVLNDRTVDISFDGQPYPWLSRREDVEPASVQDDAAGYETDADPKPRHGDLGTCATCGGEIEYFEETRWNGLEDDVIASWWSHLVHPADEHDAVLGGAA
jgi:hypothetical protein